MHILVCGFNYLSDSNIDYVFDSHTAIFIPGPIVGSSKPRKSLWTSLQLIQSSTKR